MIARTYSVLGHEGDVVKDGHVGVTDCVIGFLVGGGDGANDFGVGVLELGVAAKGFAGLLVFVLFYHVICAFCKI